MFNNSGFKKTRVKPTPPLYNVPTYSDDYDARYNPKRIKHTKKLFFSSLNKNNTSQTTSNFSVDAFTGNTKDIVMIKSIRVTVDYTVPANAIKNGFVEFVDLDSQDYILGKSTKYHTSFPVTSGGVGSSVSFNYSFPVGYTAEMKTPGSIKNELRVKVYKETSSGEIELFTDISRFSMEMEIIYEDHPFI